MLIDIATVTLNFDSYDTPIGGKLVRATYRLNSWEKAKFSDDEYKQRLKEKLAMEMASFIIENKLAEFTQLHDPTGMSDVIAIRCYLAPDDQVRILRTHYGNIR
jgi:hypothetical protein